MEKGIACGGASLLMSELVQGQELMRQLAALLEGSSMPLQCSPLVHGIRTSLERAISMAKSATDSGGPVAGTESPRSVIGSPRSESSGRTPRVQERREMYKKRKTLPKWTSQVRVCSGTGLEVPPEDGFSWRKYGQKDILGAKHPRGYYRCTHRNTQGCPATKLVQRSDENPAIFDVTYRGNHVCVPRGSPPNAAAPGEQRPPPVGDVSGAGNSNPLLVSFRAGLTVKTEGLDDNTGLPSASFSFASTPVFSSPSAAPDHRFTGSFSPPFISPAASASSYLPVSPCPMNGFDGSPRFSFGESELEEMISAAASATSSPAVDLDFILNADLDPNFPFDSSFF